MEVKSEMMDFLRRIAAFDTALNAEDWQKDARAILDTVVGHLEDPPRTCPVCGALVHEQYNARYRVLTVYCIVCKYEDEWDEPDKVNAAAIRY